MGAGIEALHGLKRAREMGLHVVASDMNPEATGFAAADDRLIASTYDIEASVAAARDYHRTVRPIDGVIALGTDVPRTVAAIQDALGLPGIGGEAAALAMDKLAMKERFRARGVAVPWFSAVADAASLRHIVAVEGLPLVLKPVDSRGSRGVLRLGPEIDLDWAFETARGHSPTGRVMVERYLAGPQVSTETLVENGRGYTIGYSDRNYELLERFAPHFIENGGELPSRHDEPTRAAIADLVEAASAALGIRTGTVKGDIVVADGVPHVIELAARLSGGYFCSLEIPLNTGVDFVAQAIRLALGEPLEQPAIAPRYSRPVVQRYKFPAPGRIVSIDGVEAARALPGIAEIVVSKRPGDLIERPTDSNAAAAMAIALGDSREEAIARAAAAIETIRIETVPQ